MQQQREILRPAGLLERYHIARHSLGLDSCVLVSAQYVPPTGRQLDRVTLFLALKKVVCSHVALGVRLAGEFTSCPSFERLHTIKLSEIVDFSESCDVQDGFEAQILRPFETSSDMPLWRVVVLKDNNICFVWHHCIGDGRSGLTFHRALLSALQENNDTNASTDDIAFTSSNMLVPPVEKLMNMEPSWRTIVREVFGLFAPTSWTRNATAWSGNPVPMAYTLHTRVRLINFPPDTISALLRVCRAHQATLTSAFQILAISVVSDLLSATEYKTISSCVPISLRHLSGTPDDAFCDEVSALHTYASLNSTFSWMEASKFTTFVRSYTTESSQVIGMLSFLFGKYAAFFRGKLGKKREVGLILSNLGRLDLSSHGTLGSMWAFGPLAFTQCDAVTGPALKLNTVGDPLGGVTVAVTWGMDAIPDTFGEQFIAKFKIGVQELLNEKTTPTTSD